MSVGARSRGRRILGVALYGLAVAHVVEALLLRRRRRQLSVLPGPGEEVGSDQTADLDVVAASGVEVDGVTLAAVAREMQASTAEVVDLVPGDLPVERALRLLRRVDPERLTSDPLYVPGGVHESLVRQGALAQRMGARNGARGTPGTRPESRGELVRSTMAAQRYAPTSAVLRVAPALRASRMIARDRWIELEALTGFTKPYASVAPVLVGAETAHLAAMTVGLVVAPWAAAAALATWCAQPGVVFGPHRAVDRGEAAVRGQGGGLRPRDLRWSGWLRLPRAWRTNLGMALAGYRATRQQSASRAAPTNPPPAAELFDPRRDTCPWCDAEDLAGCLDTTDLIHHKPGSFHVDECRSCGHLFQNPALSLRGLDYYYDQAYDGASQDAVDVAFSQIGRLYRIRADAVGRFTEPRAWLDVGTGQGHFCLAARQRWPGRIFDGLDMGVSVEEGPVGVGWTRRIGGRSPSWPTGCRGRTTW